MKNKKQLLMLGILIACACVFGIKSNIKVKAASTPVYYTTTATTYLKKGAGTKYKNVVKLPKEAALQISSTSNKSWYKVIYQKAAKKKYTGYVSVKSIKKVNLYTVKTALYLRKTASSKGKILLTLPEKAKVIAVNTKGKVWYKVVYITKAGKVYTGYASKNFLTLVSNKKTTSTTAKKADTTTAKKTDTTAGNKTDTTTSKKSTTTTTTDENGNVVKKTTTTTVTTTTTTTVTTTKISGKYTTTCAVYMRKEAKNSGKIVTTVAKGKTVTVTSASGNWYKCTYKVSGKTYTGYIYNKYLKKK